MKLKNLVAIIGIIGLTSTALYVGGSNQDPGIPAVTPDTTKAVLPISESTQTTASTDSEPTNKTVVATPKQSQTTLQIPVNGTYEIRKALIDTTVTLPEGEKSCSATIQNYCNSK